MTYIPSTYGTAALSANPGAATAALSAVVGDSGSGGTKGLVPAPGSGDAAAGKFLKADGTWASAAPSLGTTTIYANIGGTKTGWTLAAILGNMLGTLVADAGSPQGVLERDNAGGYHLSGAQSFTPVVKFGGASVGQTYITQEGRFVALGSLIFGIFNLAFSAKGSSTGAATITLPSGAAPTSPLIGGGLITDYSGFDSGITSQPWLQIASGGGAIAALIKSAAGGTSALADTDLTNASVIRGLFLTFNSHTP